MMPGHILKNTLRGATLCAAALALTCAASAQPSYSLPGDARPEPRSTRVTDSTVNQKWTSEYGYSVLLPAAAKYNKIGSIFNKEGRTEKVNFILPGAGSITVTYFTEPRMVPKDYKLLDSLHYYEYDSTGRNGMIHRRIYVMRDNAVHVDVLLNEKGEQTYGTLVPAIFDGFVPPPDATFALETWRYGRDPHEYENGRYGDDAGSGHSGH
jgi:hypothetical protein